MKEESVKFTDESWDTVIEMVAEAHRLSPSELEALRRNRTARLIAAIPYLAECRNADRTAVQHLSTYLTAQVATQIFDHRREDDQRVAARLERISHFDGGKRSVIERGLNLLALSMISGYEGSAGDDRAAGVYNPIVSGVWDPEEQKAALLKAIRATPMPDMDEILDTESAMMGAWNG